MMKQKILQNIKGSPLGLLLKAKLDYFQPINWRFFAFIFFGEIMLFMVFPIESHAAVSDGVLDSLLAVMKNTSAGWMSISIDFAKHLFFGLAALEFSWSAIQLTLKKADLQDIFVGLTFKVLSLSFFSMLIIEAPTWIPLIISSFAKAGSTITAAGAAMTPSAVITQGIEFAADLVTKGMGINANQTLTVAGVAATVVPATGLLTGSTGLGGYVLSAIIIGISGIFVVMAFAIAAAQLFIATLESYFVLGGSAFMLGFLGSRWTSNWGEKYFAYAVSVGIKLFAIYLVVGFGGQMVTELNKQLDVMTASGQTVGMADFMATGLAALIYGIVAWMIPSLASSMMNGSPNMSMSNAGAAGAAVAAAPVAAALAVGAAGAQAAGLAGKAFGSTKSGAAGGISGSPSSGGGFAGGITGGTAALSRLTQGAGKAAGGAASAAGSVTQAVGKGTQAAADAVGKGISAASGAAAAIPGVGKAVAAAGKVAGAGVEAVGKVAGKGTEAVGAALKDGGDSLSKSASSASSAGGNGFASSLGGGSSAATGGGAEQKGGDKKSMSQKLSDTSKDLQNSADRKKPNLVSDGGHGSGINIRFNHE